jgi:flagellar biosynthesis regulator FlaF
MPNLNLASRAYAAAAVRRPVRQQEADIFFMVVARLQAARQSEPIARIRALADNRRLWTTVSDLVRDSDNPLPPATRAGLISIGLTVQREMDLDEPNFDFLISVNKQIAEGLSGNP